MRHLLLILCLAAPLSSCRSVSETRALRHVDFGLAGVENTVLAGQRLDTVSDIADLPRSTIAVIAAGVLRGSLPLEFGLIIGARNPADNPQAHVARFDWTLFLDDKRAATGTFDGGPTIAPGDSASFVVPVRVDLIEAAGRNVTELARMALAVAGRSADPSRIRVEARPYVDTPFGQIPLRTETIVARSIGGAPADTSRGTRI